MNAITWTIKNKNGVAIVRTEKKRDNIFAIQYANNTGGSDSAKLLLKTGEEIKLTNTLKKTYIPRQ
ncbi:hypothetical protein C2U51_25565 [Enterobacteriaceae bacterium ENNIH1]|uniref:hypothetical protein n=1 Tax=Pseudescherichia sp. TaxID=2055881 RepID=UPI00081BF672|nr:hypothetical protein [Pseudescherichia sp.]AUU87603.1 hypothetical protein C2U55_00130 [Enterobacteriaceae bacterium ENNIH3]AUV04045.1 hypothetical protein C2U51_25565 [Enterobacteriaceae bacterium ENNIH1]AUV07102.1 hypothetical protein C2U52_12825 [Enterobacteriaceae bacterium ENNIH2]PWF53747.1 hypothetical protein BHT19_0023765 [[Kluyvera] intestini]